MQTQRDAPTTAMPSRKMVARPKPVPNKNGHNGYEPPDDSHLWRGGFGKWARKSNAYPNEPTHPELWRHDDSATAYAGPLGLSASGHFQLLHASADCCSMHISSDLSVAGQSYHGYGTMLGGLTAQDRKEGSVPTGPKLLSVPDASGCEQPCLDAYRCTFFSHSATEKHCIFCSACDLNRKGAGRAFTSWGRIHQGLPRTPVPFGSSWGNVTFSATTTGTVRYKETRVTTEDWLGPILQGSYSRTLYGAEGRVPLQELRLIWLDLLPRRSLELLSQVGMCKWEAKPPLQPFYFVQDMQSNPVDAMWVSRGPARTPLPSNAWVEVTHCSNERATRERRKVESMPLMRWKHQPMWFYVASGSGVSINLGRTVAVSTYEAAVWLLRRIFPGRLREGSMTCDEVGQLDRRVDGVKTDLQVPRVNASGETPIYNTEQVVHGDIDVGSIDTIQILSHMEYFSRESKYEVVDLRWNECAKLSAASTRVQCGRYPEFACEDRATSLGRMNKCAKFNGRLLGKRVGKSMRQLSRFGKSPCSSSPCFLVDGRWFCPSVL